MEIRERQDGDKHQDAARQGVEDELDGGIDASVVTPDSDQEIHRNQHRIPEHVEEEQIERDEHADHRAFEQQHEDAEGFRLLVYRLPRAQQCQGRQESRQDQ
jgi:hypothetical protein